MTRYLICLIQFISNTRIFAAELLYNPSPLQCTLVIADLEYLDNRDNSFIEDVIGQIRSPFELSQLGSAFGYGSLFVGQVVYGHLAVLGHFALSDFSNHHEDDAEMRKADRATTNLVCQMPNGNAAEVCLSTRYRVEHLPKRCLANFAIRQQLVFDWSEREVICFFSAYQGTLGPT